jgi:hypothetical protein
VLKMRKDLQQAAKLHTPLQDGAQVIRHLVITSFNAAPFKRSNSQEYCTAQVYCTRGSHYLNVLLDLMDYYMKITPRDVYRTNFGYFAIAARPIRHFHRAFYYIA